MWPMNVTIITYMNMKVCIAWIARKAGVTKRVPMKPSLSHCILGLLLSSQYIYKSIYIRQMIKPKHVENSTKVEHNHNNLIYYCHREIFYRRKYWLVVSTLGIMILYEVIRMNKVSLNYILIGLL